MSAFDPKRNWGLSTPSERTRDPFHSGYLYRSVEPRWNPMNPRAGSQPRRLTMSRNSSSPDPARCYRCLRRSRCRQPPPAALVAAGEARSSQPSKQGDSNGYQRRSASLLFPCSGSGARRLTQTHQRDEVARAGTGHGRITRRAARDDAETRALLGNRATTGARARRR